MCQELRGKGFAKQLAVNHVVLMVMRSGSNYWPGAVYRYLDPSGEKQPGGEGAWQLGSNCA